jgi:hypothetical protein
MATPVAWIARNLKSPPRDFSLLQLSRFVMPPVEAAPVMSPKHHDDNDYSREAGGKSATPSVGSIRFL